MTAVLSIIGWLIMIENEYVMDRERYVRWTTPIVFALPIFYILIILLVVDVFVFKRFYTSGVDKQLILISFFAFWILIYLAFFHKWVVAISNHKYLRKRVFKGNLWTCRALVDDYGIKLFVNGELTNTVSWDEITCLAEGKTFVSLKRKAEADKIVLFDDSYKKGTRDELINYIKTKHSNIPVCKERLRYCK